MQWHWWWQSHRPHLCLRRNTVSGRALAETVGLGFKCMVLDHRKPRPERVAYSAGALLYDVRQFMAQQLLAL
jgi:hypothetical protein